MDKVSVTKENPLTRCTDEDTCKLTIEFDYALLQNEIPSAITVQPPIP